MFNDQMTVDEVRTELGAMYLKPNGDDEVPELVMAMMTLCKRIGELQGSGSNKKLIDVAVDQAQKELSELKHLIRKIIEEPDDKTRRDLRTDGHLGMLQHHVNMIGNWVESIKTIIDAGEVEDSQR